MIFSSMMLKIQPLQGFSVKHYFIIELFVFYDLEGVLMVSCNNIGMETS